MGREADSVLKVVCLRKGSLLVDSIARRLGESPDRFDVYHIDLSDAELQAIIELEPGIIVTDLNEHAGLAFLLEKLASVMIVQITSSNDEVRFYYTHGQHLQRIDELIQSLPGISVTG